MEKEDLRIIFMGTPEFAVPSLKALIREGYEIAGVFTQPDRPKGRGNKMLPSPVKQAALEAGESPLMVNANVLIGTYLVLTFGELLLSPMGISFVSKVAPPKYKGMMMGGWFVATALGNFLVSVGGFLWGNLPLWLVWSVFVGVCLIAAIFMFSIMKKLEEATK